jgi:hypothetical protein
VKLTVWGDAGGPGTIAATYNRSGQLTEARTYGELDLELPPEGIEVDCDHDARRAGEVVLLALGKDQRLRAVAVLDDDWLSTVEQDVFFSPLLEMRGPATAPAGSTYIAPTGTLLGLSLTFASATCLTSGRAPRPWRRGRSIVT